MGLACGTFVVSYLKTLDMPVLRLFFSKTEDRNQWHRDPEAVYNTPRFQNVSTNQIWNSYLTWNTEMLEPWKQYVTLFRTKMYSNSNFWIQTPTPPQ